MRRNRNIMKYLDIRGKKSTIRLVTGSRIEQIQNSDTQFLKEIDEVKSK